MISTLSSSKCNLASSPALTIRRLKMTSMISVNIDRDNILGIQGMVNLEKKLADVIYIYLIDK